MTSPIEFIEVRCLGCGGTYQTQFRASVNTDLDDFTEEYIDELQTGTCPRCGNKTTLGGLVVRGDVWEVVR
jgi:hypothetical protein